MACGDEPAAREHAAAPGAARGEPSASGAPVTAEPALAAPSALVGEDRATCTARLAAGTPPEVRATLVDLGWTDFYGDACGAAIAVRDRAAAGCDDLSARALRERCRLRVAVASAEVAACPPARSGEGHDPYCVALASGMIGLCRGASFVDQASCRALLGRDPERCAVSPAAEARCRAEVAELAAVLPAPEAGAAELDIPEPELVFEVRRVIPGADGETVSEPERISVASFERGAVMVTEAGATRITLGDGASRGSEPTALLELELPADVGEDGALEATLALGTQARLELRLPDVGRLSGGEGEVVIVSLEPRLGGRIEGRVRAELLAGVGSVRVTGRFVSYVRDRSP